MNIKTPELPLLPLTIGGGFKRGELFTFAAHRRPNEPQKSWFHQQAILQHLHNGGSILMISYEGSAVDRRL